MQVVAEEVESDAVLDGIPGEQLAAAHEFVIGGAARGLPVIVRAAAPGEKTETLQRTQIAVERVRQSLLEPADGSGADAGEDDAGGPGLAQDLGQPPLAPDAQHALGVAAADVDHVLA